MKANQSMSVRPQIPAQQPAIHNSGGGDGPSALAHNSDDANDEFGFYHVQANLNCAAMADVVVWALNEAQAQKKAQQVFDRTRFHVVGNTRTDSKVYASLLEENVDVEICEINAQDDEPAPVEQEAIRTRVEAELGRLLLLEMESLDVIEKGWVANLQSIRDGIQESLRHRLFESLWALYEELHSSTEDDGTRLQRT